MKFKMYKWETFNDGWFTYYRCPKCNHKQQLIIYKNPLPERCSNCKVRLFLK